MTDHLGDANKMDHIIKAAQEARLGTVLCHNSIEGDRVWIEGADWHDELERFYAIAYQQGMEKAAEICESRAQMLMLPSTGNFVATGLATAIRAHAQNIDMTKPSCTKSEGN